MKKNIIPAILLAALMFGGAVNSQALAQGSLFGKESGSSYYDNASNESMMRQGGNIEPTGSFDLGGVTNNENPTPLGSGIAILTAIGAGYALLKRKEEQQ